MKICTIKTKKNIIFPFIITHIITVFLTWLPFFYLYFFYAIGKNLGEVLFIYDIYISILAILVALIGAWVIYRSTKLKQFFLISFIIMILLSPVSLYLIVLFLIGGFTAVINVIEMVIFTIFPWIAVPIGLIAILLIIILNQVNRKAFAKVKVRKIILIILACIVITMAITWGSWFPYLDVRSNQCEYNGIKYKEFSKHPIKDCWCEGQGDGVEKAVWVCKGG